MLLAYALHTSKFWSTFPWPTAQPGIYSTTLDKADKCIVRAKGEATYNAKQEGQVLYNVAEKETIKLFV